MDERYINQIEVLVNLFTIDKGKLKVLLLRKETEPFKGYWLLPSNLLMVSETIEECANETLKEMIGLSDIYLKQCDVFSKIDRLPNERILANSLLGLVDTQTILLKKQKRPYESAWFTIDSLPKMVFDHGMILEGAVKYLRKELTNIELLKIMFPNDFTMPELQVVFEQVLNKELDRRNFRKKFINLDILEDTGDKNNIKNGRPAKLYRFKEETTNIDIF